MGTALYTQASNAINTDCPYHSVRMNEWADDLPSKLKDLVVAPINFEVFEEYEVPAVRTCGRDAADQRCYCAFRWLQTELRSDDDEVFFEVPVYAEALASWRLLDERWLTCRATVIRSEEALFQTSFSVSDFMPR